MTDYRQIQFGYFLRPDADDPEALRNVIESVAPQVRDRLEAGRAAR